MTTLESPPSFDMLPQLVGEMFRRVCNIEEYLKKQNAKEPAPDRWFNIDELCEYLPDKPAKATIHGKTARQQIPFHKSGKKLRFLKSEIDKWLLEGKVNTLEETAKEVDQYLSSRKK